MIVKSCAGELHARFEKGFVKGGLAIAAGTGQDLPMQTVDLLEWLPAWTKVLLDLRVTTLVIALATAANVFVAWVLWRATKKSSDAARDSAVAAIRSAQAAEHTMDAMYRPYFAVCGLEAVDLVDKEKAHVQLTLKNYGPVPLTFSNYLIELVVATGDPTKPAYHEQFGAPATSVVLPADEATPSRRPFSW